MKGMGILKSFYVNKVVYYAGFGAAALFVLSYFFPFLFTLTVALLLLGLCALFVDVLMLYSKSDGISAERVMGDRFSNGDDNKVQIQLHNHYPFKVYCQVLDELPTQFTAGNRQRSCFIQSNEAHEIVYYLKPSERGEYLFGNTNVYINSPLGLAQRRYTFEQGKVVKVYPSYLQMRRYQLLAIGNRLQDAGSKRVRKLGQSIEFEQIKEYVRGDDYRTINWKATARRGDLMVNNFTDEKSQQIFCIINKGRVMKMPFEGLTLLDYAINASLVLANVALTKGDKAGLITFAQQVDTFLPADKKPAQLNLILDSLYKQQTDYLEPDPEKLFSSIRNRITQRSLVVLFTNFESMESLQRDLPFLKKIAHYHLLVVVFFENTEVKKLIEGEAETTKDIYIKTIARKYNHEKRLIVKELQKNGIVALLTTPQNLTVNALNKYLDLKTRQSI